MSEINDLPIELYELILKNLSIKDLFNCRLVNKKFKNSTYKSVHKLVIGDLNWNNEFNWFYNNELIDEDDEINLKCFTAFKSIFNLNKYLKYLRINLKKDEELSFLNDLINLKSLEIYSYNEINFKLNLNLENLKYFKVDISCGSSCFELNTPKLKRIQFESFNDVCFKSNPESIKHLITNNYEDQLKQFKNVEIIEFKDPSDLDGDLLSFFNNLKQLRIDIDNNFNEKKEHFLIRILNNRIKLNKDVDIYFEGVKMMNIQKLKEFKLYDEILEYQIKNYDLLDLCQFNYIYYSDLINYFNNLRNDLPSSFFDKFQNISVVHLFYYADQKSIDFNCLNWFLNSLNKLKCLIIVNALVDQNFFDNLPNKIIDLSIKNNYGTPLYLDINFDFILKLTKLKAFILRGEKIDLDLFDFVLKSFLNLKYLKRFDFRFKGTKISIIKGDRNYDQLLELCNEIKSELLDFYSSQNIKKNKI